MHVWMYVGKVLEDFDSIFELPLASSIFEFFLKFIILSINLI